MNAPAQIPPTPTSALDRFNVFAVAERVIAKGSYAQFSALEQLAVCLWITERLPRAGQTFAVTILAVPDDELGVEEQARRMNLAHSAAEIVLRTGQLPPPTSLFGAIEDLLEVEGRAREAKGIAGVRARADLRDAVAVLKLAFEKETANAVR